MIRLLKQSYEQHPLRFIVLTGLVFRLIAAYFSRGYGWHDDHFLVIEAGQSIASGHDYNNWLPWNSGGVPSGHSWFYVGIHIILFKIFHVLGINDPQMKMILIRTIHALYSLCVITLGYKITSKFAGESTAKNVAWILALLWFPMLSVRNLVEWVCVPPLLASSLALIYFDENKKRKYLIQSACFAGIAMGIRYQSVFFIGGTGLFLLWRKEIMSGFVYLIFLFITFFITQSADLFIWKKPFVELTEYVKYNFSNSDTYGVHPWYFYLITLSGIMIPPISLFLFAGYFKSWKKLLPIAIPSFCFFIFHSYFPNKQERFILPFVPYLVIGGMIGWQEISANLNWKKFENGSWKFFWTINALALILLCTMYSKRSKVEAMYYLYNKPDYNTFAVESSHLDYDQTMPQYYSGRWQRYYRIYQGYTTEQFAADIRNMPANKFPNYILFFENENLQSRVKSFEKATTKTLEFAYEAEPSYMDNLLHWLNKRNKNQPIFVYRVKHN